VLGREGENVAPGFNQASHACRRDVDPADGASDRLELGSGGGLVAGDGDRDLARLVRPEIVGEEEPAVLVDDGRVAEARPLDVVFLVVGELGRLLRRQVGAVEVHDAVPVGNEVDRVAVPHREHVHGLGRRQRLVGFPLEVPDGDGAFPAAPIALPGAELLGGVIEGEAPSVGREADQRGARQVEHLGDAAVGRNEEEPVKVGQVARAIRAEKDAPVGGPPQHHIARRVIGQADGFAAPGRDDEDIIVAVVLAGEGDPFPVGRESRVELVAGVGGEAASRAALGRGRPQVPGVDEDDLVTPDAGLAQEPGRAGGRGGLGLGKTKQACEQRDGRKPKHISGCFHGTPPHQSQGVEYTPSSARRLSSHGLGFAGYLFLTSSTAAVEPAGCSQ
jgi:hypothetical protein